MELESLRPKKGYEYEAAQDDGTKLEDPSPLSPEKPINLIPCINLMSNGLRRR